MIDATEDKVKELKLSISDLEKAIDDTTGTIATLTDEIKVLEEEVIKLDRTVAEATFQRKEEHAEFEGTLAANNAVVQIIEFAKNRLQKFYNPKLYKPPPKRELTEEERITLNMDGTLAPTNPPAGIAGTGVTVLAQKEAPPPPPA